MVDLLILKYARNFSDECVIEQWYENIYYQHFCDLHESQHVKPCAASELVHFYHCIGEEEIELILKESIRISGKEREYKNVYLDATVHEKDITFFTTDKPTKKLIKKCLKIAESNDLQLRQTYTHTLKKLSCDQRFSNHQKIRVKNDGRQFCS